MKRDKKGPLPLLITPASSRFLDIPTLLSPLKSSPVTESFSSAGKGAEPNHRAGTDSPLSWIKKPALYKSKSNPLLSAAAKSILSGDFKMFESFQASKNPKSGSNIPQAERIGFPLVFEQKTTFTNLKKRVPVPKYDAEEISQLNPALENLRRTASHDRHRFVRPGTAESKHSRTGSLPYNQLNAQGAVLENWSEPLRMQNPQSKVLSFQSKKNNSIVVPQDKFTSIIEASPQLSVRNLEEKSDDKRLSNLDFDGFRAIISKRLGTSPNSQVESNPLTRYSSMLEIKSRFSSDTSSRRTSTVEEFGQIRSRILEPVDVEHVASYYGLPEKSSFVDRKTTARHSYHFLPVTLKSNLNENLIDSSTMVTCTRNQPPKSFDSPQIVKRPWSNLNILIKLVYQIKN
ncbi:hypothetical protein BY996DRAFT_7321859 [Phakopsora pachyrhizi]|nr:hypothetical protein BY996DRAFT_7632032 [Phakopsora pachyrhizi]KAI8451163.1 hypothetical protein BY996DRAFT_7321859 [Phakopsora pachyrhizi]